MSLLSTPVIADTIARAMGSIEPPAAKGDRGFPEISGDTRELTVPTRHGELACTLYRPPARQDGRTPGIYVNLHGGGYVVRGRRQDDPWCRYLAANAGVFVLNVEYDVAPRVRFPVPVEEAYDVVAWAAANGGEWDATRIGVGGQSAGGALAAGAARLALEQGGPALALQVLHYAPLDLVTAAKDKPAPREKVVIKPWMGEVFDTAYVPDVEQRRDRLVSPAWGSNAEGIEGIAPALVVTCEYDRLRSEGVRYAEALERAGALRAHLDLDGVDHGYDLMTTREASERGYRAIVPYVRDALG